MQREADTPGVDVGATTTPTIDQPTSRQRPPGSSRSRDALRDRKILDATLMLLSEHGPDSITMESVATLAGVSKSTVYRRWASASDLIADAIDTLRFPFATCTRRSSGVLRDDLAEGLIAASGCLDETYHRIVAGVLEAGHRHPGAAEGLRRRFLHAIHHAIDAALRSQASPEARRRGNSLPDGAIEVAVVAGLIINLPHLTGRRLERRDFVRIVDEALLPVLMRDAPPSQRASEAPSSIATTSAPFADPLTRPPDAG